MNPTIEKEILDQLDRLGPEQRRQVLESARALAATFTTGVPGESLNRFSGTIDRGDLGTISEAIEDACEQVRPDEW